MLRRLFAQRFGPALAGLLVLLMLLTSGCAISGGAGVPGAGFNAGVGLSESGKPTLSFGLKLDLVESGCAFAKLVRADRFEVVKGFCPSPTAAPEDFSADGAELPNDVPSILTPAFGPQLPATAPAGFVRLPFIGLTPYGAPTRMLPLESRFTYPAGRATGADGLELAGILAPFALAVRAPLTEPGAPRAIGGNPTASGR